MFLHIFVQKLDKMIDTTNEKELAVFEEKQVRQHNAITSGRYDFTACQLDILFMLLGFLEQGERTYTIYVKDIEKITGREWKYAQLRQATEDMGCRMFEIETEKDYTQLWLFSKIKYRKGEGCFDVTINEEAFPYFSDLKNNYTYLHLKSILCFSSKYAKRLYAIACQWRTKKHKIYEITELKQMLGLIDKKGFEQYKQIGQFKEYVLDVAMKQINEHSDITFDYKLIKKGRSFRYIEILVNTREQIQLQINFNDFEKQKFITRLTNHGFNSNEIEQITNKITPQEYGKYVDILQKQSMNIKKEPLAYLRGILKNKGIIK